MCREGEIGPFPSLLAIRCQSFVRRRCFSRTVDDIAKNGTATDLTLVRLEEERLPTRNGMLFTCEPMLYEFSRRSSAMYASNERGEICDFSIYRFYLL